MTFITELDVTLKQNEIGGVLNSDLSWFHDEYGLITVPAGFETDFASVPGWVIMPGIVPRIAMIAHAAVVHDYLYVKQIVPRETADKIFLVIMKETGVSWWRRRIAYAAVRVGGGQFWDKRTKEVKYDPMDYI